MTLCAECYDYPHFIGKVINNKKGSESCPWVISARANWTQKPQKSIQMSPRHGGLPEPIPIVSGTVFQCRTTLTLMIWRLLCLIKLVSLWRPNFLVLNEHLKGKRVFHCVGGSTEGREEAAWPWICGCFPPILSLLQKVKGHLFQLTKVQGMPHFLGNEWTIQGPSQSVLLLRL